MFTMCFPQQIHKYLSLSFCFRWVPKKRKCIDVSNVGGGGGCKQDGMFNFAEKLLWKPDSVSDLIENYKRNYKISGDKQNLSNLLKVGDKLVYSI